MLISKTKKLKISIITVSYNSEKTIKTSLNSVKCQTHKKIEHIIIDGNSADKTVSIVKQYPHISKIISEPDDGIYDAMNKGLQIATGDIICFLNSDDFYASKNVLNSVSKIFINNPTIDACYSDLIYVDRLNTSKIIRYFKSSNFNFGAFAKGWSPPHLTFFAHRSVYERFGNFDLNYHIASDVELMMRFLEVQKINARYIPEMWIKMRVGGISNKNFKNILIQNKEVLHALKKHNLSVNWISFFVYKIINRGLQVLKKPYI
jgi:glycosyltransferase involved in cell wall biosynthesis